MPDTWPRDLPVLVATAEAIDERLTPLMFDHEIAEQTGIDLSDVQRALRALIPTYLSGEISWMLDGDVHIRVFSTTEAGRRAAGLWPSGEGVDALVDALRQAERLATDDEDKSLLRRAAAALGGVSRGVMTDVLAAWIKSQTHL